MTATPPEKRILDFLEADAGVATIVGTDIFTPNFPDDAVIPGIIFFDQGATGASGTGGGGRSFSNIGLRNISIQTHCYAARSILARTLHEAVRTAFLGDFSDRAAQDALLRTFNLVLIEEEQEGQTLPFDEDGPDKGTAVMLGFWTIWFLD